MGTLLDRTHQRLTKLMEEFGVETYVIVMRDPDDGTYRSKSAGSRFWIMGAMQYLLARNTKDCLDEDKEEDAGSY